MLRSYLEGSASLLGVIACAVLAREGGVLHGAEKQVTKAIIFRDASVAPIVFAAGEIRRSLEANEFSVREKPLEAVPDVSAPVRIVLMANDSNQARREMRSKDGARVGALGEQAYVIRQEKGSTADGVAIRAIGTDAVGAMYGGLHVAERIRLDKGLDAMSETSRAPYLLRRGIKFNIPLDARTPGYDDTGDAAQSNYVHMWDFSFWEEFLDEMARHRYNTLTLWNPHPFPSIVKLPNYPDVALRDVCVTTLEPTYRRGVWGEPMSVSPEVIRNLKIVKKLSIDEKISFWRQVMQRAKNRGIDIYFITWNILTNGAEGKYGITNAQDNSKTIGYLRECVRECVLTYPLLAGIGITAGERMKSRADEFSKEKWLWKAYGLGILDAKKKDPDRSVRLIHRVWQTGVDDVMEDFGRNYPDPFELSFKYARAHMYSSTRPPFADALCRDLKRHGVKCWWNLRNDDIFNFRWGDPDYVREFLENLPPGDITAGYHMGSDGYVWGREFTSLHPDSPPRLEMKKHWYKFMLWGRLGYDPTLDRTFFVKVLSARFPGASAADLYDAWAAASKIVPLVNRFHWRDWDFQWAVEGCIDQTKGFHTVDDFIKTRPMQSSGMESVFDYVDGQLANKPSGGITPIQVAAELRRHAQSASRGVVAVRRKVPKEDSMYTSSASQELRQTLADIQAMAHLGNYYGSKILGAVELCAFRKSKDAKRRDAAIRHLRDAVKHWEGYATVAASQYRPQLLARTRRLDWMRILEDVKKDVEIARRAKVD